MSRDRRLRDALLCWFEGARRSLPWREDRTPYRVWVSEVMLQQTRVEVVIPYYERFLARFPSLAALAAADEQEVLAAWSGLGYYRRARYLLKGARAVVAGGGSFPRSHREALALPGVGEYTAAAVLSLAYGLPHAAVDGNVIRVLARLEGEDRDPTRGPGRKAIRAAADRLLDRTEPGRWNEALMELGALVCGKSPRCLLCPWRAHCRAAATGRQAELPALPKRRASVQVTHAAALVERGGRLLLCQRPAGGRMARMWELPGRDVSGPPGEELRARLAAELGVKLALEEPARWRCSHGITHHAISVHGFRGRLQGGRVQAPLRWVTPAELEKLALTGIARKLLELWRGA